MTHIKFLCSALLLATCCTASADSPSVRELLELEAEDFMHRYLAVYNRRLGNPDRSEQFRRELSEMVLMPLMVAPPMAKPRVPTSMGAFTENFEGFVSMLETSGVTRLEWQRTQMQVLTKNKILANNVGHGVNAAGEIVYETVSLYLLFRSNGKWQIALFSPYDTENI